MASFWTKAADTLTPWNRKGEVQRRQQAAVAKKKKRDDQQDDQQVFSSPTENISQQKKPQVQRPENLFAGLNQNLKIGQPQTPAVSVQQTPDTQPVPLPAPGTIIKPKQSIFDKARDVVDANTEADKYRRATATQQRVNQQLTSQGVDPNKAREIATKQARSDYNKPDVDTIQSKISTTGRSAVSVGSNVTGGLLGALRGAVETPKAVAELPSSTVIARMIAAKLTGNKEAMQHASQDAQTHTIGSDVKKYAAPFVSPLIKAPAAIAGKIYSKEAPAINKVLTRGEQATDELAQEAAPFAPSYVKPSAKVLANVLPVDALAAGLIGLSKARNAAKLAKEGEVAVGGAETAGIVPRVVDPRRGLAEEGLDIADKGTGAVEVPVRRPDAQRPIIQEIGGDAPSAGRVPSPEEIAAQKFAEQPFPVPDQRIEGVTPRQAPEPFKTGVEQTTQQDKLVQDYADMIQGLGEGNGVNLVPDGEKYGFGKKRQSNNVRFGDTKGKRMNKQDWRDEARRQLEAGQAEKGHQQAFDDARNPEIQSMLNEEPATPGAPVRVKEVKGIPVQDQTVVPQGLPEIPGTVRVTEATAPNNARSAQVAEQPPIIPKAGTKLPDGRTVTKSMAKAARANASNAKKVARANEQTAEAMGDINTASPAAQSGEGFVGNGEFGKSANGGTYAKTSRKAEMDQALQETSQMSPGDVLQTARKNQGETGGFNRRDIRNVAALFESKRIPRGTPEWQEARQILKEDGTVWGQTGALRNYTMRRTASADELISRFESKIYRLAEDPTKIESKLFDQVEEAEVAFADTRDEALAAYNRFTEAPTSANAKAYHAAQDAAEKADKASKETQYKVASKVLKGNKDVKQARELEKLANDADLYQMDAVDASMLSGTGTFTRNLANASVGGAEEGLLGRPAAWIARKLTGESVGGGVGRGTIKGLKEGASNIVDASRARAGNAGKNPFEHAKNWATTGNQLGDAVIDSQASKNTLDHYTHLLKEQGFSGEELKNRASVTARQDPDNIGRMYSAAARTAAGLGGGITRGNKIETIVKNMVSDAVSFGKPNAASENMGKLITRMTIGFPTAVGRSTAEGVKRFTLGVPTFIKAARTADPAQRALLIKEGVKQAGTGSMVVPPLFYALGANDMITGAYPDDQAERDRWAREGISENSIKIGGAYYQLPAYLGAWAVPGLFYASLGRNKGDFGQAAADVAKSIPAILPTDNVSNWLDVINGNRDPGKFASQTAASAVRAATPAGALLNQLAKSFDHTANDTTSGTNIENFVDKVMSGIPGLSKKVPNKEVDGQPIYNPNAGQLALGAASAVQGQGEAKSAEIDEKTAGQVKGIGEVGALKDPNIRAVLDDKDKAILDKVNSGKKVDAEDVKKLQDALVKGVSQTGDDTAYLEREQYDSNLSALNLKKQLMEADKSVKPSDIKKVDTAIKRGKVYKDGKIPYELIDAYETTGVDEWRKMGDPEADEYDADMYEKLWALDEKLTKVGASYKKGDLEKQKYSAKTSKAKGGRGGGLNGRNGEPNITGEFGKLKGGDAAPDIKAYASINSQGGGVPAIKRIRPNIVHKIGSSG